jgi:hypothetical protein
MINSLWLLTKQEPVFGSLVVQITAPLYTLLVDAFRSTVSPHCAFERLLDYLPFVVPETYVKEGCTFVPEPRLHRN